VKREITAAVEVEELASPLATSALPTLIPASELYRGQVVSLRPLIDGLLWDGLTLFVAKPKAGKSWATLQLAIMVAGGPCIPGLSPLADGPVLYCAFEEPAARTMARLRKIAPVGAWADRLHFLYELLPFMGGGAEQLEGIIAKVRPRVVVLDTLTALLKGGGKRDNDVFRSQYAEVSRIRKIAENHKTAIVLVHHTRKGVSEGIVEAVAGTGGIAAAADTLWQLKRKPEGEATLEVVGREVEEKTFALQFRTGEACNFGWHILGDDALQMLNSERRQVLSLLQDDGAMSPAQIAAELAKSRPSIRMMLKRMREDGILQKQGTKYVPSTLSVSYRVTEREKENL
jgi:biotin operon repressor